MSVALAKIVGAVGWRFIMGVMNNGHVDHGNRIDYQQVFQKGLVVCSPAVIFRRLQTRNKRAESKGEAACCLSKGGQRLRNTMTIQTSNIGRENSVPGNGFGAPAATRSTIRGWMKNPRAITHDMFRWAAGDRNPRHMSI